MASSIAVAELMPAKDRGPDKEVTGREAQVGMGIRRDSWRKREGALGKAAIIGRCRAAAPWGPGPKEAAGKGRDGPEKPRTGASKREGDSKGCGGASKSDAAA